MQINLNITCELVNRKGCVTIDDQMLRKYGYVLSSSYRVKTMKAMQDEVKTPSKIAEDAGIRMNHISKVLKELKDTGVAECINPEVRKGKLYRLTSVGEEIVNKLE